MVEAAGPYARGATHSGEAQPTLSSDIDALERLVLQLSLRFDGCFSEAQIFRCVFECHATLRRNATVHTHLVALTAKLARERLADPAYKAVPTGRGAVQRS